MHETNGYIKLENGYSIKTAVKQEDVARTKLVFRLYKEVHKNNTTEIVCVEESTSIYVIVDSYLEQIVIEAVRDGDAKSIAEACRYYEQLYNKTYCVVDSMFESTKEA